VADVLFQIANRARRNVGRAIGADARARPDPVDRPLSILNWSTLQSMPPLTSTNRTRPSLMTSLPAAGISHKSHSSECTSRPHRSAGRARRGHPDVPVEPELRRRRWCVLQTTVTVIVLLLPRVLPLCVLPLCAAVPIAHPVASAIAVAVHL